MKSAKGFGMRTCLDRFLGGLRSSAICCSNLIIWGILRVKCKIRDGAFHMKYRQATRTYHVYKSIVTTANRFTCGERKTW